MRYLILTSILSLAAFTHLWNPIGFPSFYVDEGDYMRRALQTMDGLSFQESRGYSAQPYDHPYFGQIFLAFIFKVIGYPDSLNPKPGDVHSVEMLYLVPRILMGLLAVLDTYLVYKIADKLYGTRVAFIASILFAVMPMTWILRRIYLDSILLPFLFSSIFFAVYYANRPPSVISNRKTNFNEDNNKNKQISVVLLSGIFLGLAIFTKIPVFMMIPLVAYLIYKNIVSIDRKGKLKTLGLWFIPVILIPAIWPAYNILYGHFDDWLTGVLWQTSRYPRPMENIIPYLLQMDPLLLILGTSGIVFSAIRKDTFVLLWSVPYFGFLTAINYVGLFHFVPLIPVLCIAGATILAEIYEKIKDKGKRGNDIQPTITSYIPKANSDENIMMEGGQVRGNNEIDNRSFSSAQKTTSKSWPGLTLGSIFITVIVAGIATYGLANSTSLILSDSTASFFEMYTHIISYLPSGGFDDNNSYKAAIIAPDWLREYYWIPRYVFNKDLDFLDIGKTPTDAKFILLADKGVTDILSSPEHNKHPSVQQLFRFSRPIGIYDDQLVKSLPHPDIALKENYHREIVGDYGGRIEIRANY
jgi:hypothetical protein